MLISKNIILQNPEKEGNLNMSKTYNIAVLKGDGIGPEVNLRRHD